MYALETLTVDRAIARLADPACRGVFNYWDHLRGERPAPDRREMEPFDIAPSLGDIVMLDTNKGEASVRLTGSRLASAVVKDIRAQSLISLWAPGDRKRIGEMLSYAVACPAGMLLEFRMHTISGRSAKCEAVLLPLRLGGDIICRLIGAISFIDAPYWLGTEPMSHFSLDRAGIFPTRPDVTLTPRFARAHPVFDRAIPLRTVRHLALYDGGLS